MIIRNPFTGNKFFIGRKAVAAEKQKVAYGSYQNTLASMLSNAGAYRIGFETLYLLYNSVGDIKSAIRRRQKTTIKEGFRLVNAKDREKPVNVSEAKFLDGFFNNQKVPFRVLKNKWVRDRQVAGNSYWQIVSSTGGAPLYLDTPDPRTMVIVADQHANVQKYLQKIQGQVVNTFDPKEIIHSVSDYSTTNPLLGVSPIESIVWEARGEMAAQTSNYFFYENNAVPSHLLIVDTDLSPEQHDELKKQMDAAYKGSKNRFKSGIIPFVKDVKTISPSQKDMEFIASRKHATQKIASAFDVDPFLLGYTEGVQRSNASIIKQDFYESTVRPDEKEFEDLMNDIVLPRLGIKEVRFEVIESDYDDEKQERDLARVEVAAGVRTINEARKVIGLPPSDNELADELMMNGDLIDDLVEEANTTALKTVASAIERKEAIDNLLT
jgi:HK97 family phage portal protein